MRGLDDYDRQRIRDKEYKTPSMLQVRAYQAASQNYTKRQMRELIRDQAEYIKKLEAEKEAGTT